MVYLIVRFRLKPDNSPIDAYFFVSDRKNNWVQEGGFLVVDKAPVWFDHLNTPSLSDFGWLGYSLTDAKGLTAVYITIKGRLIFV